MRKVIKVTEKDLREKLVEIEKKIVGIERNRENFTGKTTYLSGMAYEMDQIYGYAADSPSRHSHSFSLMMTDADYVEVQLDDLKRQKAEIEKQLAEIENNKAAEQMGQ